MALRGRTELGSTFFRVLDSHARTVRQGGGRVLLADVSGPMCDQLWRTGLLRIIGPDTSSLQEPTRDASILEALAASHSWR